MSFIDLKMLSASCIIFELLWDFPEKTWLRLRSEIGRNLQAKLGSDTLDAVLSVHQRVAECRYLDARLRPDRLQMVGRVERQIGMFDQPLIEQRNIVRRMGRISAEDMKKLAG